ncbi:class I SAM-dependent methyltransferase [Patescibacteria group bacterium]|nr:class I SAM-dependent methyltransferase [Patescibacteria group bacterium]MBU4022929.1 class I SAM-dependent methyltransferase [Patescibacteria group bacterium]MBU4078297.1 class I SAM-dependent methyltransferase [Patescibacteria group bacterium]
MRKQTSINYKKLYNRVGQRIGWDFSKLKVISEGEKHNFYQEVVKSCQKSDLLLDIGTGGGEKVLKIAPLLFFLIGIDSSEAMINTADKNLRKSGLLNVRFLKMDAKKIIFPDEFFDIISCRHSNFFPKELIRALTERGIFLTQQVSEADKINIKKAFGRGQNFRIKDGTTKDHHIKELRKAGFSEIKSFDYNTKEFYQTPEDLIFLLRNTPIIPNFGCKSNDFKILTQFIKDNATVKGIATNSKRYMIIAKK